MNHLSRTNLDRTQPFTLVEALVVAVALFMLAGLLMPMPCRARGKARRIGCAANLRSIGQSLELYSQETDIYHPSYPPGFDSDRDGEGLRLVDLPNESLQCPSEGGSSDGDYAYVGTIKMADYAADMVIVADFFGNHPKGSYMNILKADLSAVVPVQDPERIDFDNPRMAFRARCW